MRSWVRPASASNSPKVCRRSSGANATGAGNFASYSVRQTKRASAGTRASNPSNAGDTNAAVSWRARSARKFMNTTASPSAIGCAPSMTVGSTNSSFSPRAYAASSAATPLGAWWSLLASTIASHARRTRSQRLSRSIA